MIPYEILIRGKDGKFAGAHVLDTPDSPPRPVKDADWPDILKDINTEVIVRVQELESSVVQAVADKQAVSDKLDTLKAAQADLVYRAMAAAGSDQSPEEKLILLGEVITDAARDERERKRFSIEAELEQLKAAAAAKTAELDNL